MRTLLVLVARDLRQHVSDRSVLLFGLLIPFALSYVFNLAFSGLDDPQLGEVAVVVSAPAGDPAADAVVGTLGALADQGIPVTVLEAGPGEVADLVASGEADLGVTVPEGFGAAVAAGEGARVELAQGADTGLAADVVSGIVTATVQRLDADAATVAGAAGAGLDEAALGALAADLAAAAPQVEWGERTVAGEQLGLAGGIVAGQAGMFLFFTVGFAVLTLLTEREWGTLPRLRTMPIPAWQIPFAKAVVGLILGTVSTSVLLASGQLLFDGVDFGWWPAVLVLVVATVAAATSVIALVVRYARTAEQASLLMSVIAISLGVTGGTFFRVPTDGLVGTLLQVNPVAALVRGLGITAGGGGIPDLAPVLLTLLAFTLVILVLARLVPGRKDAL
ncbi:ABC transporter permease [Ornithinimicrobium cerasi]|uniref:ABC-2 type transport system permease protein n=1 Tax=Ornithinimicrobium cerasi TaxID=2248773 RepID=A0A285W037_9MICO|nr:ABC transporter permease [Ornithinimicrobium cerasi]SOC58291.1 ABC-2 type transport system permease protein [Ornithinimicrobium cerasi]